MTREELKAELKELMLEVGVLDVLEDELPDDINEMLDEISGPVLRAVVTVRLMEIFARYFSVDLEKVTQLIPRSD